jgi:hypothetical protein
MNFNMAYKFAQILTAYLLLYLLKQICVIFLPNSPLCPQIIAILPTS